jgi:prepilin-type N-terminal cleavage/methylation domain-containing protein
MVMLKKCSKKESGFTLVEILVALLLLSLLLGAIGSVVQNASTLNAKAKLRAEAGSLAFKKIQDYINLDFDSLPIGDGLTSYEVEDFSLEAQNEKLANATAKVYSEPASQVSVPTTTSTSYTQAISADTTYVTGGEISSAGQYENDATNDWYYDSRIKDDNYTNYSYSNDTTNTPSPAIDLGSSVIVDTIRVSWFYCGYGADNFRIEAKNSAPRNNSGWTTVVSGLSDNGIACATGVSSQDIDVRSAGAPYRYWRLFMVDAEHPNFSVISELSAFSAGTPSDTVEQNGADASSNPGELYFSSSDLEMSQDGSRGQQSIGMIFNGVNAAQGANIDNAYLNFTADETHSGNVTLLIKAPDVDSASPWSGTFAVDNAVDNDSSDGSVGTTASVVWNPLAWTAGDSGANTQVDVTSIIQELIDRVGWTANNDLALTVQYVSGSSKRVAERFPAPQLVINWTETTVDTVGGYVDADSDGDADNPTLLKVTAVVEYDTFETRQRVEYSSYIRKFGIGD